MSVLRDATGKVVIELEKADISRLLATGWKPPTPITVKDRGGVGDLYGLLYRPTNFDPARKYPIVNRIYPGPQTGSVGSRQFSAARARFTGARRARLHRGRDRRHGDAVAIETLPRRVLRRHGRQHAARSSGGHERAGVARFPWIDIERAGIYGHSGGGFATAAAMFRYPDFFKVGVSQAGNHDNRVYEDDWAEKWHGLLEKKPDGTSNYDNQANQNFAQEPQGQAAAGARLDGYQRAVLQHPARGRCADQGNKDFDLIIFPNRGHGFGNEPYMVRRRWDYFVKHLLGAEPPAGFELKGPTTSAPTP